MPATAARHARLGAAIAFALALGLSFAAGPASPQEAAQPRQNMAPPTTLEDLGRRIDEALAAAMPELDPDDPTARDSLARMERDAIGGYVYEQFAVGEYYRLGHGFPRQPERAADFIRKAAEKGLVEAQLRLGMMYAQGEGVPRDGAEAYLWWALAADAGDNLAIEARALAAPPTTTPAVARAKHPLRQFKQGWASWGRFALLENPALGSRLVVAARNGDTKEIQRLLDLGADADAEDGRGRPALVLSAMNGHGAAARALLSRGADANAADEKGKSALMWAAENGDSQLVGTLLAKSVDINATNKNGETALINATWRGQAAIVRLLLDQGAAIDQPDNDGGAPLMWAAVNSHSAVARVLLARGAAIDRRDEEGLTALARAAWNGALDVVRVLLEAGADPTIRDDEGHDALARAASEGHGEIVALLRGGAGSAGEASLTNN